MHYCPKCDAEYRDEVKVCTDDGAVLLDRAAYEAELRLQGRNPQPFTRLAVIARLADRFEAEELAQALADEGFELSLVADKGPTVGPLTTPGPTLYQLVVRESEAPRAAALLVEWRADLESPESQALAEAEAEEEAVPNGEAHPN